MEEVNDEHYSTLSVLGDAEFKCAIRLLEAN